MIIIIIVIIIIIIVISLLLCITDINNLFLIFDQLYIFYVFTFNSFSYTVAPKKHIILFILLLLVSFFFIDGKTKLLHILYFDFSAFLYIDLQICYTISKLYLLFIIKSNRFFFTA